MRADGIIVDVILLHGREKAGHLRSLRQAIPLERQHRRSLLPTNLCGNPYFHPPLL
jgi:hypothetical protein